MEPTKNKTRTSQQGVSYFCILEMNIWKTKIFQSINYSNTKSMKHLYNLYAEN